MHAFRVFASEIYICGKASSDNRSDSGAQEMYQGSRVSIFLRCIRACVCVCVCRCVCVRLACWCLRVCLCLHFFVACVCIYICMCLYSAFVSVCECVCVDVCACVLRGCVWNVLVERRQAITVEKAVNRRCIRVIKRVFALIMIWENHRSALAQGYYDIDLLFFCYGPECKCVSRTERRLRSKQKKQLENGKEGCFDRAT